MRSILIIDDEQPIRNVLAAILEDEGFQVFTSQDGPAGLELLKTEQIDLIFLDIWMPKMGGMDVLKIIKKDFSTVDVVIISGHANIEMAINAVKIGAFDLIEKPLDIEKILSMVKKVSEKRSQKNDINEPPKTPEKITTLDGESPPIQKVKEIINQSAPSNSRVLILGENGTGKEVVARMIHTQSPRADKPFIEVNCAAIPENLIESELFGHEKGSFTGAFKQRIGQFEAADGGSLFLDEVAELSLPAQAKMLRFLQEMEFTRVGGRDLIKVDIRVIAATNKNIMEEVRNGNFREDLFFRLNVIPITLPPLRERPEDIPLLLKSFLQSYAKKNASPCKNISSSAQKVLMSHFWPGNIRELKNFAERASVMCEHNELQSEEVLLFLQDSHSDSSGNSGIPEEYEGLKLNEARDQFERTILLEKLEENDYNIAKTAESLGIYPSNLHNKIKKYGIEVKK